MYTYYLQTFVTILHFINVCMHEGDVHITKSKGWENLNMFLVFSKMQTNNI